MIDADATRVGDRVILEDGEIYEVVRRWTAQRRGWTGKRWVDIGPWTRIVLRGSGRRAYLGCLPGTLLTLC